MFHLRGSCWGPLPLPDFLRDQLEGHGFSPSDAGRCARLIGEQPSGSAAAASLFVDLGSCKFLEADIDGAIAAWRHAITSDHAAAASRALLNLGLLHEHLHLHDRALELLARVAERDVDPYIVPAAMASARCQVAVSDGEAAMETMARLAQRIMASRPDDPALCAALFGLGEIAEQAGRPDRAERAWRAALAGGDVHMQRAALERLVGLLLAHGHQDALLDLLSSSTLESYQGPAPVDVAEMLVVRDQSDKAADVLASVTGEGWEPVDRFRLATVQTRCGMVNESIDELEALLGHPDPQVQARALVSLGQVYAAHDMDQPARSMFARAIEVGDDYWTPVASRHLVERDQPEADKPLAPVAASTLDVAGGAAREPSAVSDAESPQAHEPDHPGEAVQVISLDDLEDAELIDLVALGDMPPTASLPAPSNTEVVEPAVESGRPDDDVSRGEPVVVVLNDFEQADEDDSDGVAAVAASPVLADPWGASPWSDQIDEANPYAALAPDHDANDVLPSTRNPYAELAPNFDDVDFEPPPDVEPGDWESILRDRPLAPATAKPKKAPSAFSRHT